MPNLKLKTNAVKMIDQAIFCAGDDESLLGSIAHNCENLGEWGASAKIYLDVFRKARSSPLLPPSLQNDLLRVAEAIADQESDTAICLQQLRYLSDQRSFFVFLDFANRFY